MKAIIYIFILPFLSSSLLLAFSGKGAGTEKDPYQITTIQQLQEMNDTSNHGQYWIMMNDIDAEETKTWNIGDHDDNPNTPDVPMGFEPIRILSKTYFDGKWHKIIGLYVNSSRNAGLFDFISEGFINNLGLIECDISGRYYAGSFCAYLNEGAFFNCFSTGKVFTGDIAGGFCGYGSIVNFSNCYTQCSVKSVNQASSFYGSKEGGGQINYCYATGKASAKKILPIFSELCHIYRSVWDIEKTGNSNGGGYKFSEIPIGLSSAEMMKNSTFEKIGWSVDVDWCIDEGKDYPKLRKFGDCPTGVDNNEQIMNNNLLVYYCQFTGVLKIQYLKPLKYNSILLICNLLGQVKKEYNINENIDDCISRFDCDVTSFESGIYFINLIVNNINISKKFIIVK